MAEDKDGETPLDAEQKGEGGQELAGQVSVDGEGADGGVEKRLKDAQAAFHEKAKEAAELRERIAKLEGRFEEAERREVSAAQPEDPFAELENPEFAETLIADPAKLQAFLKKQRDVYGNAINQTNEYWRRRYDALEVRLQDFAPEKADVRRKVIEMAAEDAEFAKLPRDAQEWAAKRELQNVEREVQEHPGSPGNGALVRGRSKADEAYEREVKRLHNQLYSEE
jgi:hypothetical protein